MRTLCPFHSCIMRNTHNVPFISCISDYIFPPLGSRSTAGKLRGTHVAAHTCHAKQRPQPRTAGRLSICPLQRLGEGLHSGGTQQAPNGVDRRASMLSGEAHCADGRDWQPGQDQGLALTRTRERDIDTRRGCHGVRRGESVDRQ